MKPLEERLNDRLEQAEWGIGRNGQHLGGFTLPVREREHDSEVDELVALARRLQQAHQLQVAPDFARQLERRMVRRYAELQLQLSGSPADQATLDLQFARDRLKTLPSLVDTAQARTYRQALADLDQQVNAAAAAINELPVGAQQTQLAGELASLKLDAIHVLRGLLARLALPEQLGTTNELARLGDTVPLVRQASLTLSAHPNARATISFTGLDLQPGAHLLVDGKVIEETGTLQHGQMVFVMDWNGNQHPLSLGILNPDGTATETTAITIKGAGTSGTPGGNQNGNENKPTATPTPHGNQPSATPTLHHERVGEPSPLERQQGGNPKGNQPQKLISPGSSGAFCCEKTRTLVFFPESGKDSLVSPYLFLGEKQLFL